MILAYQKIVFHLSIIHFFKMCWETQKCEVMALPRVGRLQKCEVMTLPPLHACNFFLPPLQVPRRLSSSDQKFARGSALLSILRS